jgi:hypothetical protein
LVTARLLPPQLTVFSNHAVDHIMMVRMLGSSPSATPRCARRTSYIGVTMSSNALTDPVIVFSSTTTN